MQCTDKPVKMSEFPINSSTQRHSSNWIGPTHRAFIHKSSTCKTQNTLNESSARLTFILTDSIYKCFKWHWNIHRLYFFPIRSLSHSSESRPIESKCWPKSEAWECLMRKCLLKRKCCVNHLFIRVHLKNYYLLFVMRLRSGPWKMCVCVCVSGIAESIVPNGRPSNAKKKGHQMNRNRKGQWTQTCHSTYEYSNLFLNF